MSETVMKRDGKEAKGYEGLDPRSIRLQWIFGSELDLSEGRKEAVKAVLERSMSEITEILGIGGPVREG